jgi:3' exoribonuclease, RNase T-like
MSDKKTIYEVMETFQRVSAAMQEGLSAFRKQFEISSSEVDKVMDDTGRSLFELAANTEMEEYAAVHLLFLDTKEPKPNPKIVGKAKHGTRYFIDCKFIEDGKTIELISIGIVSSDGREFYAENSDCDLSKASEWVKENVIANLWSRQPRDHQKDANFWLLDGGSGGLLSRREIRSGIFMFCNPAVYGLPEFWAGYASYDWIALCQVFGTMMDLPKGFPQYCHDIRQECDRMGNPPLPAQEGMAHHALADARYCRQLHEYLEF